MSLSDFDELLANDFALVIVHNPDLKPKQLEIALQATYGNTSSFESYALHNGNAASVVEFSETAAASTCFRDIATYTSSLSGGGLSQNATARKESLCFYSVGWLSENEIHRFESLPYVKGRNVKLPRVETSVTPAPPARKEYLLILLHRAPASEWASIAEFCSRTAAQVLQDEVEGGRIFAEFNREDEQEQCREGLLSSFASLLTPSDVSYSDQRSFELAMQRRARGPEK